MNSIIFNITKKMDRAQFFSQTIDPSFITWDDILDYCIPPVILNIELIKNKKIDIPKDGYYFDSDFIRSEISKWTIYNERATYQEALNYVVYPENKLTVKTKQILNPGDVLFIPSGVHHQCRPLGKRLSLSIPIL
jgi:hypothetical protein